jgi:hypothetical protein
MPSIFTEFTLMRKILVGYYGGNFNQIFIKRERFRLFALVKVNPAGESNSWDLKKIMPVKNAFST